MFVRLITPKMLQDFERYQPYRHVLSYTGFFWKNKFSIVFKKLGPYFARCCSLFAPYLTRCCPFFCPIFFSFSPLQIIGHYGNDIQWKFWKKSNKMLGGSERRTSCRTSETTRSRSWRRWTRTSNRQRVITTRTPSWRTGWRCPRSSTQRLGDFHEFSQGHFTVQLHGTYSGSKRALFSKASGENRN